MQKGSHIQAWFVCASQHVKRGRLLLRVCAALLLAMCVCSPLFSQQFYSPENATSFVRNGGQWSSAARYAVSLRDLQAWFANGEVRYALSGKDGTGHVLRWHVVGGQNSAPQAEGLDGANRTWIVGDTSFENVLGFSRLSYRNLAPGVDARFQLSGGTLKYDVIVAPGVDPSRFRMRYEGASGITVAHNGNLHVHTSVGDLVEERPVAFQTVNGQKMNVPVRFHVDKSGVGFAVGEYNRSLPLVIDPTVRAGSFIGGNGFDEGRGIAADSSGNLYVVGVTGSEDFPTTIGAIRRSLDLENGSRDVFITKFDPTGRRLIWATYFGGNGYDDPLAGVRVTRNGTVLVAGVTRSSNFPSTFDLSPPESRGKSDGFVFALTQSPDTNKATLLWSTYVGGVEEDSITAFDLRSSETIILTGTTFSENFPIPSGGRWPDLRGGSDAFVLELSSDGKTALAGTFLGGTNNDFGKDVVLNRNGNVLVTGFTLSDNFPRSQNALISSNAGGIDGFLLELSPDYSTLEYGTYLGGSADDYPQSLALDSTGSALVTGFTQSADFPDNINATGPGGWFASKINTSSGALDFSRYLTSNSADKGAAVHVDRQGRAVLYGMTSSSSFPTPNGIQTPERAKVDLAFVRLSPDGSSLDQGSVVGGSEDDFAASHSWLSTNGLLYVTGRTLSANLPVGRFGFDTTLNTQAGVAQPDAFLLGWSFDPRANLTGPLLRTLDTLDCAIATCDTFYVYNYGDAPLTIVANRFKDENVDFIFKLQEPPLLPQPTITVLPGDSLRYIVCFETRNVGYVENTLFVFSSDSSSGKNPFPVVIRAARSAPAVLPAPAQVRFGNVLVCNDSTAILTLNNNGDETITIEQPEFVSSDGPFHLESSVAFPVVIPKRGDPVRVRLTFSPQATIAYSDTLILRVRECPESEQRVAIIGRGESVRLEDLPKTINFPDLASCSSSHDSVITVRNNGTVNLIFKESNVVGDGFQLLFPNGLPDTLAPNTERKITVRFSTDVIGNYSAVASLSVAPCDTTYSITLAGARPEVEAPFLSLDTVDFNVLTYCAGEFAQQQVSVEITNPSDDALVLSTPTITLPFSLCNPNFLPQIPPNSTRSFLLCYTPTSSGKNTGLLRIPYDLNGCKDTLIARLIGERERPELVPQLSTVDFSPLGTCESSHDTTFFVYNHSKIAQSLDSLHLTRGVEVVSPSLPHTIPAGDSVEVRMQFVPVSSGTSNELARFFYSSRCVDSLDVVVSGFADGFVVAAEDESLNLPVQLLCNPAITKEDTVFISWTGTTTEDVSVQELRVVGANPTFVIVDPELIVGTTISEGERFPIPVQFFAEAVGKYRDTLEIVLEPCLTVLRIPLNGEVVQPELRIAQAAFGNIEVDASRRINVIVSNDSPVPLVLDTLSLSSMPYSVDRTGLTFPVVVPPRGVIVLPVTFAPTTVGEFNDSLVVQFSGDCDYRLVGGVSGNGVRSAAEVTFCVNGLYSEPRFVGETATIFVKAEPDVKLDTPVDLTFYFQFDPMRFNFVGAVGGVQTAFDPVVGTVAVEVNAFASIPGDLPGIRLQLLGGKDLFALASLDSVVLRNGTSLFPNVCDTFAIVSITNHCFVEGVSFGKYPNRLEHSVPNPANDVVEITFQQLEDAHTTVRIWNAEGREVLRPVDSFLPGGKYSIRFTVDELSDGLYFYGVQAGSWNDVGRMLIQR